MEHGRNLCVDVKKIYCLCTLTDLQTYAFPLTYNLDNINNSESSIKYIGFHMLK